MTQIKYMGYAEHRCKCYQRVQDHPVCNGCGILVGKRHLEPQAMMKGVIVNQVAQENEWSDFKIIRTVPMRLLLAGGHLEESQCPERSMYQHAGYTGSR